jgi:hypothetical protein
VLILLPPSEGKTAPAGAARRGAPEDVAETAARAGLEVELSGASLDVIARS